MLIGKGWPWRMGWNSMAGAALLIGNASYSSVFPPLKTPGNDIENLGDRMRDLGFDTIVVHDADRATMTGVLARFREEVELLPLGTSVFVYFAGHGFQRQGENYLVPVDATDPAALAWSCVTLSDILTNLCWRSDQQKIIALDACRSNRLPSGTRDGEGGLAGISTGRYETVKETVVLYATEPGQVASDGAVRGSSPFCRGLLKALEDPHQPISLLTAHVTDFVCQATGDMQTPWSTGTLRRVRPFVPPPEGHFPAAIAPLPDTGPQPMAAAVGIHPGDREVAAMGHLIHKLKAKDSTGRWAYYFILVPPENETAFLADIAGDGVVDLERYGSVVASSYGETPSDEVRAYLKERYGFDV